MLSRQGINYWALAVIIALGATVTFLGTEAEGKAGKSAPAAVKQSSGKSAKAPAKETLAKEAPAEEAKNDSGSKELGETATGAGSDEDTPGKVLQPPTVAPRKAPTVSWLPPADVKTRMAMLCIHGFTLHKGCYEEFGKEMAKNGIATYAIDLRGFGESKDNKDLDFDGIVVDCKAALEQIHKDHPALPVLIVGESMGGAIAMRTAAFYPELVSGLISSVPARDRFGISGSEAKVAVKAGFSTIFGGFRKRMTNVTGAAVQKISEKEELRSQWKDDPLMRNDFSPRDFMLFDKFMSKNLTAASMVKTIPVLFIQGTEDKLIRPAGTWKLYEQLGTPNRQLVLSKSGEHLIFEEGQFKPEDIGFVTMWINKNITQLDPKVANTGALPVVASKDSYTGNIPPILEEKKDKPVQVAAIPAAPAPKEFQHKIAAKVAPQINFWIELYRDGKVYRCNNKMQFKSGDSIRFHLIPQTDGYAYLVMKASTTGKSDVLFPHKEYGTQNFLNKDTDYTIPAKGWMQFDQNPGTEQLGLLFAANKVDVTPEALKNRTLTCFVSPTPGAKDICPTRMKLSWDDPTPVVIPEDFEGISQLANAEDSSLVRLRSTGGIVAASIQLLHGR